MRADAIPLPPVAAAEPLPQAKWPAPGVIAWLAERAARKAHFQTHGRSKYTPRRDEGQPGWRRRMAKLGTLTLGHISIGGAT